MAQPQRLFSLGLLLAALAGEQHELEIGGGGYLGGRRARPLKPLSVHAHSRPPFRSRLPGLRKTYIRSSVA